MWRGRQGRWRRVLGDQEYKRQGKAQRQGDKAELRGAAAGDEWTISVMR